MLAARLVFAPLALLLLAAPALSQSTEKAAIAQVKASAKAQLKAFKATCSAALGTLDANLKTMEDSLDEGSDAVTVGAQFTSVTVLFVSTVDEALEVARGLVDSAAHFALEDLEDGGDLAGLFPEDLYYGTGGVLDLSAVALEKAAAKVRVAAVKRLAKASALAEKKAGLLVALELRLPVHHDALAVNPSGLVGVTEGVLLDLVLSCSDVDLTGDGALFIAGSTANDVTDVTLGYFTAELVTADADVDPDADGRFIGIFTDLDEGGYCAFAHQATGIDQDAASIGVR